MAIDQELCLGQFIQSRGAVNLDPSRLRDIELAANIIRQGGIGAIGFNGIFGLFGNVYDPEAYKRIYEAKNRPEDNKLILVTTPDRIPCFAEIKSLDPNYRWPLLSNLWSKVHALGAVLPASPTAPIELVDHRSGRPTVLPIWTDSNLLLELINQLSRNEIDGLVGTSGNKSGQPTITEHSEVIQKFGTDLDFIFYDDFSHLPAHRRISTSIVDYTRTPPHLNRSGNVSIQEIIAAQVACQLPGELVVSERTIFLSKT